MRARYCYCILLSVVLSPSARLPGHRAIVVRCRHCHPVCLFVRIPCLCMTSPSVLVPLTACLLPYRTPLYSIYSAPWTMYETLWIELCTYPFVSHCIAEGVSAIAHDRRTGKHGRPCCCTTCMTLGKSSQGCPVCTTLVVSWRDGVSAVVRRKERICIV